MLRLSNLEIKIYLENICISSIDLVVFRFLSYFYGTFSEYLGFYVMKFHKVLLEIELYYLLIEHVERDGELRARVDDHRLHAA